MSGVAILQTLSDLADRVHARRRPRAARGHAVLDDELRRGRLRKASGWNDRRAPAGVGRPGAGSGSTSGRGRRDLRVRVKTAKGRKLVDALARAPAQRSLRGAGRAEGYRGRAAYKILEIDDKFGFLRPAARVVDLGAAPGGWTQVAVARVNALGEQRGKPAGGCWRSTCRRSSRSRVRRSTCSTS
jgi:hypothetical protein